MKKPEITEKSRNTVINGLTIIMTFIEKKEKHSYLKLWLQVTKGKIRIFFFKKVYTWWCKAFIQIGFLSFDTIVIQP